MSQNPYPIIFNYEYDNNKIVIIEGKKFKKQIGGEHDNYVNIIYDICYSYSPLPIKKLYLMTDYLTLTLVTTCYNKFTIDLRFVTRSGTDQKIVNSIDDIIQKIKKHIIEKYPTITDEAFVLPYKIAGDGMREYFIDLESRQVSKENKNCTNLCPIFIHRTKAKGGNVVKLCGEYIDDTYKRIREELPMFKNSIYLKNFKNDPNYKDIHYEGKFILNFKIVFSYHTHNMISEINYNEQCMHKCKIQLCAKEMEIKHNVSTCESMLENDLTKIELNGSHGMSLNI